MADAIVTGPLSFTGKYLTKLLIESGKSVAGFTNDVSRANPFPGRLDLVRYSFDNVDSMATAMRGARTFYNTYWIRYPRGEMTYERAVQNSIALFSAAKLAGVQRIVHTSIANPSADSPFGYYRGKAGVELALVASGIPHSILRPTVFFGKEDILINNIAWLARHSPLFLVAGNGNYRIQPIAVEDYAALMNEHGERDEASITCDAVGPETYPFVDLVELIKKEIGSRARIVRVPQRIFYLASLLMAPLVRDTVVTWDEVRGLMANLLISNESPMGRTSLKTWLSDNAGTVGVEYHSERSRHYGEGRVSA
ncbi:MAG: NmrA family NAD(P)-binding protein [Armatimonadetes bacterium]|nr:NmrA family NAD(P)-binding protein [Armatimonadota bacterium]